MPGPVVVFGHIRLVLSREKCRAHIVDHRSGRKRLPAGCRGRGGIHGQRVGDRFDGRAGLAQRQRAIHCALNRGVEVVRAADHGANGAGLRIEGDNRCVLDASPGRCARFLRQTLQVPAGRSFRLVLPVQVQGRGHTQTAAGDCVHTQQPVQLRLDVADEMRRFDGERRRGELELFGQRQFSIAPVDVTVDHHESKHGGLAQPGSLGMVQRVVGDLILQQSCQHAALGEIQLGCVLAEVGLCGRFQAGGEVAVIDLVEIKRQDLAFRVAQLDLNGQPGLAQLAPQRLLEALVFAHQRVARQLLGQRRCTRNDAAVAPVQPGGAANGQNIDAGVVEEPTVFDCDCSLPAGCRDLVERERHVLAGVTDRLVEQPAVAVGNEGAGAGRVQVCQGRRGQICKQRPACNQAGHRKN